VGGHLAATKAPVGPIDDSKRVEVVNGIVEFCYRKLEELVASLAQEGVLEFVIGQHEAIVQRQALGKATIATRLACFGNHPDLVSAYQQDEARDAISIRFLIEYLAAVPPGGKLPMTLERFDEMLTLASEIVNFGMLSDSVRNEVVDLALSVVASGRLGIKEDEYRKAADQYLGAFASHEIYVGPRIFRRLTSKVEEQEAPPPLAKQLDAAAMAEFGYSMGELNDFLTELLRFSDPSHPFSKARRDEVHSAVRSATGWSDEKINHMINSLVLAERPDFLKPSPPFTPVEVYPWRLNRNLSYLAETTRPATSSRW
jgi:hypothetical protein